MAGGGGGCPPAPARSTAVPSLPPPRPKSPPAYPDLYGKRREMAKVQILEREIGFLQEELKSDEGIEPASIRCKEITEFVVSNPDPIIPANRKKRRSCTFLKWLCRIRCFNLSWICCCCYPGCCFVHLELPQCCDCKCHPSSCCRCSTCPTCRSCPSCSSCFSCALPKGHFCSCPRSSCCNNGLCGRNCCVFPTCSCPDCSSCKCKCKCKCSCFCPTCL